MYCSYCGHLCPDNVLSCPNCGRQFCLTLEKNWLVTLLLCLCFGCFGAHRFFTGKHGSAIAQLLMTLSVVLCWVTAIWVFVDFIMICAGSFRCADGTELRK